MRNGCNMQKIEILLVYVSISHPHLQQTRKLILEMSSSNTSSSTYGQQQPRQQRPHQQRPQRDPKPIIYSLCIPRVFKNITEKRIRAIFYSLKLGFVERVDMVAKTSEKGDEFWRVFVHFSDWNEKNSTAVQMREKLDAGEKTKIVYDSPWFWLISKSNATPRLPRQPHVSGRPAPFIDFNHTPAQRASSPEPHSPQPTSPPYTPSLAAGPRTPSPEPRSPHPDRSRPPRSDSMMAGCVEEDPDAPMTPSPHVAELLAADAEGEEEFRRKKELNAYGI